MFSRRFSLFVVFGLCLLVGCAYGEVRQVIRAQFASELHCSDVALTHRALWFASDNPNQYKVTGCGVVRSYTCTSETGLVSYDKPACTWVNGDADAPQAQQPSAASGDDMGDDAAPQPSEDAPKPADQPKPAAAKPAAKAAKPAK